MKRGGSAEVKVNVRNFESKPVAFEIAPHAPLGLITEPKGWGHSVAAQTVTHFMLKLTAAADATPGVRIVAFDITRAGKRQGELFDCIVEVVP
jgi:hypothetical protein